MNKGYTLKSRKEKVLKNIKQQDTFTVNFICSGNIIRSPYAEMLFEKMVNEANEQLAEKIKVESGGVTYHNTMISRESARMLMKEGITKDRINQFSPRYLLDYPESFEKSDLILVMERNHISRIPRKDRNKAFLLLEYVYGKEEDVPDPYFDPPFERSYIMIKNALETLLEILRRNC